MADARLVVIDIAGGVDRHFAGRTFTITHRMRLRVCGRGTKFVAGIGRQPGVLVHAQRALRQRARDRHGVDRIHHLRHHRNGSQLAHGIGRGQHLVAQLDFALLELDCLGPQHQMREIQVPGMRRHIGAFGDVTDVAQIALVDHLGVILLVDTIDLTGLALIHQIEQGGKGSAQRHTTAAAVTDVEHPLHLVIELVLVIEVRVIPVQRMSCRGFEIAFARSHGVTIGRLLIVISDACSGKVVLRSGGKKGDASDAPFF